MVGEAEFFAHFRSRLKEWPSLPITPEVNGNTYGTTLGLPMVLLNAQGSQGYDQDLEQANQQPKLQNPANPAVWSRRLWQR
jgi:hypothetical protein